MTWTNQNTSAFTGGAPVALPWIDVATLATGGDGSTGNPWTGWETPVNALGSYTHVHFRGGYYLQSLLITAKSGWVISGEGGCAANNNNPGVGMSVIRSAGLIGAIEYPGDPVLKNTDNGFITIRDLMLYNTNASNLASGILARWSQNFHVEHVTVWGFGYGFTNLGVTQWSVSKSNFFQQKRVGIYVGNGTDYKPPYTDKDYSGVAPYAYFNDIGSVSDCEFNHTSVPASPSAAIVLEGTYAANIESCKFNGADYAIWATASNGASIGTSTFEGQVNNKIAFTQTTYLSGTASGYCGQVTVHDNVATEFGAGVHFINVPSPMSSLTLRQNLWAGADTMVLGCANIGFLEAFGNGNTGAGAILDANPARGIVAHDRTSGGVDPKIRLFGPVAQPTYADGGGNHVRVGTATLNGASPSTITVANTSVTANTIVILSRNTSGGTPGNLTYTTTPGTSFTINSGNGDSSTVNWLLIESA